MFSTVHHMTPLNHNVLSSHASHASRLDAANEFERLGVPQEAAVALHQDQPLPPTRPPEPTRTPHPPTRAPRPPGACAPTTPGVGRPGRSERARAKTVGEARVSGGGRPLVWEKKGRLVPNSSELRGDGRKVCVCMCCRAIRGIQRDQRVQGLTQRPQMQRPHPLYQTGKGSNLGDAKADVPE